MCVVFRLKVVMDRFDSPAHLMLVSDLDLTMVGDVQLDNIHESSLYIFWPGKEIFCFTIYVSLLKCLVKVED